MTKISRAVSLLCGLFCIVISGGCGGCDGPQRSPLVDAATAGDAAVDAASPACPAIGSAKVMAVPTRPFVRDLQVADTGSSAMAVWAVGSPAHASWAKLQGGVVIAHGELTGIDVTFNGRLYAVANTFVLHDHTTAKLLVFDGTSWLPGTFAAYPEVSGAKLLGFGYDNGKLMATVFDGTTVMPAVAISEHYLSLAASDGAGGFGVVTVENPPGLTHTILRFVTFDGTSWSAESPLVDLTGGSYVHVLGLVPFNASWAVLYAIDNAPQVAIPSNGTWTATPLTGVTGTKFSLANNAGKLAVVSNTGLAAIFANGTWTSSQLVSTIGELEPRLESFGAGFVAIVGGSMQIEGGSPLYGAVYDGTAWGTVATLTMHGYSSRVDVTRAGNRAAVGFFEMLGDTDTLFTRVAVVDNGMWRPATNPISAQAHFAFPEMSVEGDVLRVTYIEPGRIDTRILQTAGWSSPSQLPMEAIPGGSVGGTLTRAGNGHVLATWIQADGFDYVAYASELGGGAWGPPVELLRRRNAYAPITVAADASTFVIAYTDGSDYYVAPWTGSGLGVPTHLASDDESVQLVSDGTKFMATWTYDTFSGRRTVWTESVSGTTWSSGGELTTTFALLGGTAGVLALGYDENSHPLAVMFQNGTWSAPVSLPTWYAGCKGAVGTTSALVICMNAPSSPGPIQAALFKSNVWSTLPIGATSEELFNMVIATDGTDYRLETYRYGSDVEVSSHVLHDGTWSAAIANPGINKAHAAFGSCGGWAMLYGDTQLGVATAKNNSAYAADHATSLTSLPNVIASPQGIDAFWDEPTPTSFGQPMFHVQLGL